MWHHTNSVFVIQKHCWHTENEPPKGFPCAFLAYLLLGEVVFFCPAHKSCLLPHNLKSDVHLCTLYILNIFKKYRARKSIRSVFLHPAPDRSPSTYLFIPVSSLCFDLPFSRTKGNPYYRLSRPCLLSSPCSKIGIQSSFAKRPLHARVLPPPEAMQTLRRNSLLDPTQRRVTATWPNWTLIPKTFLTKKSDSV